jgi:hypothetical protein
MNAEVIRSHFTYDPETGAFERIDSSRKRRQHTGAQNRRKDTSYHVLTIDGKKLYAHRAAWLHVHGHIPDGMVIDHINGNGLDNRLCNLRAVSQAVNQRNRRSIRAGGLAGVYYVARSDGYTVQVSGKHIGWSKDFFEACCMRKSYEAGNGYVSTRVSQ